MIWLVGNKGMLGTELQGRLEAAGLEAEGTDREVSILDPAAIDAFAAGRRIDWIVNCAAYTAVDRAEDEPGPAMALNRDGPANLARLARRVGARFLHISTDYVFGGTGSRPYLESDPVDPAGAYGATKAEGEKAALAACPETVIVRTAWLYGRHGPNFAYTMIRLMRERDAVGVVADQRGTPTYARDLADALVSVVRSAAPAYGVYHFTNSGETNWHEFATAIRDGARAAGILARDCAVNPLTTDQYPTKTRRPAYSILSKEKIGRDYGIRPRDWRAGLAAFLDELARDPERLAAFTAAKK